MVMGFFSSDLGRQQRRRAIHISWSGIIFLRSFYVVKREFTETVDTTEEGGTVVSKIGRRFCTADGRVTLGGIGGTKSKSGFQGMGGRKDVAHRSVGLVVVGLNTSWERMSGSATMALRRAGFCCWRIDSGNQHSAYLGADTILLHRIVFV